eukprot:gb/GFBE01006232.1/.p1 GENE.gb/GFBE01006232.1/~~gb/GFBE01006232.1/.p1  ORF type:complete len:276 (+),score=40.41 gb/GFBE01006232.1/:1-828(+)
MATVEDGAEPEPRRAFCVECFAVVAFVGIGIASAAAIYAVGPTYLMTQVLLLLPKEPDWVWFVTWSLGLLLYLVATGPFWQMVMVASGLVFGLYHGSVINFIGTFGGAVVSMVLGRTLLQEPIRRLVDEEVEDGRWSVVRKWLRVLEDSDETLKLQMLFRFLYIPIAIRNYGPGTLNIPMWKLIVSSVPHCLWISVMFASLGSSMKSVSDIVHSGGEFELSNMNWQHTLMFGVSFAISTLFAVYAGKVYMEQSSAEGDALVSKNAAPSEEDKKGP